MSISEIKMPRGKRKAFSAPKAVESQKKVPRETNTPVTAVPNRTEAGDTAAACRQTRSGDNGPGASNVDETPVENPPVEGVPEDEDDDDDWTPVKEQRLIDYYKERKFLYDLSATGYHNRCKKGSALKFIAKELGIDGKSCIVNSGNRKHNL